MKGQSFVTVFPYTDFHEQLRPIDFPSLDANRDYHEHNSSIVLGTSYLKWLTLQGYYQWGNGVNFVPPVAEFPMSCPGSATVVCNGVPAVPGTLRQCQSVYFSPSGLIVEN